MIALTQTTNTEIFTLIAALGFRLISYWTVKFCLQTENTIETVKK